MKLPDRWHIIPLNQVIRTLQAGVSVNSLDEEVQDLKQIGILKTSSVTTGRFDPRENKMVVQKDICRVKTPVQGDRIILSRMNTPCLVGANAYVPQDYPNLFLPDRLWSLEPQGDFICMHWLSFVLGSSEYRQKLSELATGTSNSMKNISKDAVMALEIPYPPLPEQRRIAEFLGTWDEAIEKLERLIEAKEKRLSWIRANILTGKVRINGFSSKWKQIIFLEIASRVTRSVGKARVAPVSISAGKGFVLQEEKFGRNIAGKQYSKYTLLFPEEFTYNKGNSKTYECGCVYQWRGKAPVAVPNVFVSFSLNVKLADARFISHFFEADLHANELRKFINSGVRNDGLLNVTPDCFFKIILSLPELPEQKAIANILDTTSQEIDILRAELIMFQKQKRGLMQKLLTGVWRI